jgi:hypothetical protein
MTKSIIAGAFAAISLSMGVDAGFTGYTVQRSLTSQGNTQYKVSANFNAANLDFLNAFNLGDPCQDDPTNQDCDDRADISVDGIVNGVDVAMLLSEWDSGGSSADLTGDGAVDGADLGAMLSSWGSRRGD